MTSNLFKRILFIVLILSLFFSIKIYSQKTQSALLINDMLTIETEGIAYLGSGITESDAKTIAIDYAKRNALEQAGTYLESHTEVLNFTLVKDEIITYTGGLLKVKILRESRDLISNMFAFKVYIEATIDIKLLNERIDEIRNNSELRKQLEAEKERNNRLASKIAELQTFDSKTSKTEVKRILSSLSASEWFEKGFNAKDIKSQINYFTKATELDAQYTYAYYNRGNAYQNLGRYKDAIRDYIKAIELEVQFAAAYYNRGCAYSEIGRYKDAIRDYTKAIKIGAKFEYFARSYHMRGNAYAEIGRHKDAIQDYTTAIKLDAQFAGAYYNRGIAYAEIGRHKDAIRDFTTAIDLDVQSVDVYYNRGTTYYEIGYYDDAIRDYTKAIELDATNAWTYYTRGNAYWNLYNYQNAANDFNEYLKLNGNKSGDADKVRQWIKDLGFKPKY